MIMWISEEYYKISFLYSLTITLNTKNTAQQISWKYEVKWRMLQILLLHLLNTICKHCSTHWLNELFTQCLAICRIQQIWGQNSGPAGTDDEYKHRQFTHHPKEDSLCQVRSKGQLLYYWLILEMDTWPLFISTFTATSLSTLKTIDTMLV